MTHWPFRQRKAERGEVELLRALLQLANQLQSNLELDAVVRVVASAASETSGSERPPCWCVNPETCSACTPR